MNRQPVTTAVRSTIMKAAWAMFRKSRSSFADCLCCSWDHWRAGIGAFAPAVVTPSYSDRQSAARYIEAVAAEYHQRNLRPLMTKIMQAGGFAAEVAETVYKSGRVSPKQGWVLAGSVYFSGFAS